MANRPVFYVNSERPFYKEELVSFQFNPGFSISQKQKNVRSIHDSFLSRHHNARVLEISSKSENPLGVQLSAFNLSVSIDSVTATVESVFQSSKVYERGGPYTDLLTQPSYAAKKDPRLRESGPLRGFELNNRVFPLEPKTFFYDWLYINAVAKNSDLSERLCQFNAFTDIEFNPEKSINCQARSAAIFVSIAKLGILKQALKSPDDFMALVYGSYQNSENQQLSLFE